MKGWTVTALTVMFTVCIVTIASGQVNLPKGMEGIVPIYPGSKVVLGMDWDGGSQTIFETRDEPKAVVIFFRKAMVYKGWNIVKAKDFERGRTIVFFKADQKLQLTAQEFEAQQTNVLVSIVK